MRIRDASTLHQPVQRERGRAARRRRSHNGRENEPGRVWHGVSFGPFAIWACQECSWWWCWGDFLCGWEFRGECCGGCYGAVLCVSVRVYTRLEGNTGKRVLTRQGSRDGYRRLGSSACGVYRDSGLQAVVWTDLEMGSGGICQLARYGWDIGERYDQGARGFWYVCRSSSS